MTLLIKKKNQILKYLPALVVLALPVVALASGGVQGGLIGSNIQQYFGFGNSLGSARTLTDFIRIIIQIMLFFAGAIAVVFVIIGGYYYMTSGGNEELAEKGKKTLINAIIGVVVIILAYAIINVIAGLVSTSGGTGYY